MGYDDNTPLSGTTGGGLPAEIWRETMTRVEDGLPVRPLPEVVPERPIVAAANDAGGPVGEVGTAVRTAVQNVLKGLFGRN
jgi:membrane peptidoglycan carboxypeptidase